MLVQKQTSSTKDSFVTSEEQLGKKNQANNVEDELVWDKFLRGDDNAFEIIYNRNIQLLYNFGMQHCSDDSLVYDVIHDLFIRLRLSNKMLKVVSVKSYLYKCLQRDLIRKLKHKRNQKFRVDELSIGVELSWEQIMIDRQISSEQQIRLKEALKTLSKKQMKAIVLFYYENMSYREIAEILSMRNVKSARKLMYRAIDSLKINF